MYHILAGPEFNSPDRRPTSSLGILGAVQKQAVCVIKARLPEHALEARKAAAVGTASERAKNYVCGVEHTDPAIMDVMPNELVFRSQDRGRGDVSMKTFVDDHPVYGKQYLTGDIQVEAFSALNGLSCTAAADFVFVGKSVCVCACAFTNVAGVATSSQIQKNGIDGFAVQVSGSVTINNAHKAHGFICAGDWIVWQSPDFVGDRPRLTVVGTPRTKALAELLVVTAVSLVNMAGFVDPATGDIKLAPHPLVIGRALTSATQCQEFDLMLQP
jgi:hypothetical protein